MAPLHPRNRLTRQLIVCIAIYTHTYQFKSARNTSSLTGEAFMNELLHGHPALFFDTFRMPITTFQDLCTWLQRKKLLVAQRKSRMSLEQMVSIFLSMVGHNMHSRDAQNRFQHSPSMITKVCYQVLDALLLQYSEFVRPPTDAIPGRIARDWDKMKYCKNMRGAIDGTHIEAHIPAELQVPFHNRKGTLSQNGLAGCTLDMYFFYCLPGWEGSANDARVLEQAMIHDFAQLPDRFYLADAGYGLRKGILTPYKGIRYHLREQAKAAQ